ncbi:unnamed protein product [Boreogadus saida]
MEEQKKQQRRERGDDLKQKTNLGKETGRSVPHERRRWEDTWSTHSSRSSYHQPPEGVPGRVPQQDVF